MLKILFVCSGNKVSVPGPVVANQKESLEKSGVRVDFFLIKGKGIWGYLKNLQALRKTFSKNNYDLIHAHGVAALLATLSLQKPLVVSLLGSELNESAAIRIIIKQLAKHYWSHTIVKSEDMASRINLENTSKLFVIPNGVNLDLFKPIARPEARKALNWPDNEEKIVLFLGDITRKSKNFSLADNAFKMLGKTNVKLVHTHDIPKDRIPFYLNAADVIISTSLWEGSPNIIKEAMACNRPVVGTDVGDVKWLFGDEPGYYLTSFDPADVAEKIMLVLAYSEKQGCTDGRNRIMKLNLNAESIAKRIIAIYNSALPNAK